MVGNHVKIDTFGGSCRDDCGDDCGDNCEDGCGEGCGDRFGKGYGVGFGDSCRDGCRNGCRDRCDIVGTFGNRCQDHWGGGGGSGRGVVMKIDQYEISIVHKNC